MSSDLTRMGSSKILFVEFESPIGHVDVNCFFIKNIFPHFSSKYFLLERHLYDVITRQHGLRLDDYAQCFPTSPSECRTPGRVSGYLNNIDKLKFILTFMEKEQIPTVYFLSYETVSLSLLYKKFLKYCVILHDHANLRFSKNALRRFLLKRLSPFNHIIYSSALNNSVRKYLEERIGFSRIFFVDHQVNDREHLPSHRYTTDSILLFAPSASNDPAKVVRLLRSMKSDKIRFKVKVGRELRNKYSRDFKENLLAGFMKKGEFEDWMERCDFVVLLHSREFRLRTSGLMFDAVSFGKPLITDNEFIYEGWIKGSGIGLFVNGVEEIEEAVLSIDEGQYNRYLENVKRFKESLPSAGIGRTIAGQIQDICA